MRKRLVVLMTLAAALACPLVTADSTADSPDSTADSLFKAGGTVRAFSEVAQALTIGASTPSVALRALAAEASLPSLSAGERDLLRAALADPLSLLELAHVPPELIARLTLHELGPIRGAHVADVPPQTALAAVALGRDDGFIDADSLRPLHQRASVRNEPITAQAEDLMAMLGRYG